MDPTLSITLCCYNSEKYLRETLESIANQTYADWELIVINDGSSDSTEQIVLEFSSKGHPVIYKYQENAGLGNSRNTAIGFARGKYIAFIDHDDVWFPDAMEKQVNLLKVNPDCALVYADGYRINEEGKIIGRFSNDIDFVRGDVFYKLLYDCPAVFSAVVVRRDALNKIGLFNSRYNICEDYDLFLRIAESYKIDFCQDPLLKYRWHQNNASKTKILMMLNEQNEIFRYWLSRKPEIAISHKDLMEKNDFWYYGMLAVFYAKKLKFIQSLRYVNGAFESFRYHPILIGNALYKHLYCRRIKRFFDQFHRSKYAINTVEN